MKTCPRCQNTADDSSAFCPKCGQSFADPNAASYPTVLCSRCRTPIPSASLFCPQCGAPVGALPAKPFIPKKELGITSLVFGILSVVFIWLPLLSIPFSIVALITGKRAQKAARAAKSNNPYANVGAGFGRVMCILWLVFLILTIITMIILAVVLFVERSQEIPKAIAPFSPSFKK